MADEPKMDDALPPIETGDEVLEQEPSLLVDAPLGGELDEWGDQVGAVGFARLAGFPTETEAAGVARHLVEAGIGATVSLDPERIEADPDGAFGVHVLYEDLRRAAELLGIVEIEERPDASPVDPIKVEKGPIPWKLVLPIFAVALIVVPLAAGVLTYFVMSR